MSLYDDIKYAIFDYPGVVPVFPTLGQVWTGVSEGAAQVDEVVGANILGSGFDWQNPLGGVTDYVEGTTNKMLLVGAALVAVMVVIR